MEDHRDNYHLLHQYWSRSKMKTKAHKLAENWYRSHEKNYFKLPAAVMTTTATILGSVSYGKDDCSTQQVAGLWITSLLLIGFSAVLTVVQNVLGWDDKRLDHHESMLQFSDLSGDIELFVNDLYSPDDLRNFVKVCHEKLDIYSGHEVELHYSFVNKAKASMRNGEGKFKPMSREGASLPYDGAPQALLRSSPLPSLEGPTGLATQPLVQVRIDRSVSGSQGEKTK